MSMYTIRAIAAEDLADQEKADRWRDELNAVVDELSALRFHATPQIMQCGSHLVCVVTVARRSAVVGPNGQPTLEPVPLEEVQKRKAEAAAFPPPRLHP